jgi:solute carrier family 25 (mitochondrial carnitine/acylcarnitine transporter), member 20/29
MQTSTGSLSLTSFGGPASLFRGMGAPLSAATVVNAIIFSTYGTSSRLYDQYLQPPDPDAMHDPSQKAFLCGSLAGLVQCVVICPMEHIKCRLQIQHGKGSPDEFYKGPRDAIKSIVRQHGIQGLYRGWCATSWREVPAFGLYFAFYDILKDKVNTFLAEQVVGLDSSTTTTTTTSTGSMAMTSETNAHTWFASALAGGTTGALTWGLIYPIDIIKTRIQTSPWDTPLTERRIVNVAQEIVQKHGWRHLFRGLNITLIRAFPVNGIIFPVYEFTLMHIAGYEY